MTPKEPFIATGQIWLSRDGENVLNESRMDLLEKIAETGSITRAGKAVGISYRTAWLTVDHLNAIADSPLVERKTGGKSGGGTRLTAHGEGLLKVYRTMREEHGKYLERLREGVRDFDRFLSLARKISLKTSARNQMFGVVESVRKDALSATVVLKLKGGDKIVSEITFEGLEGLGLRAGEEAYALIKANWIAPAPARGKPKAGEGNALAGKIVSIKKDGRRAEVVARLKGGALLVAAVPVRKADAFGLAEGSAVILSFEASNVILGVAR
jgi:molybdate transport system regulatory protein